jgi:hypothetical protein
MQTFSGMKLKQSGAAGKVNWDQLAPMKEAAN